MRTSRTPISAGMLLLLGLVCLAACGGSGDGGTSAAPTTAAPSGTTAAATEACADVAALRASLDELDRIDPPEAGKAGLQAALQNVRTRLDALQASAGSQWGGQIQELDTAIDGFQTTIAGVQGDSLLGDLPRIVGDLERIDTAWTALEREVDQACPTP